MWEREPEPCKRETGQEREKQGKDLENQKVNQVKAKCNFSGTFPTMVVGILFQNHFVEGNSAYKIDLERASRYNGEQNYTHQMLATEFCHKKAAAIIWLIWQAVSTMPHNAFNVDHVFF